MKLQSYIVKDDNINKKHSLTQTEDISGPKTSKPWRFDLSTKENWDGPVEVVDLVEDTPGKFKKLYRAPPHVRLPHRFKRKSSAGKGLNKNKSVAVSNNSLAKALDRTRRLSSEDCCTYVSSFKMSNRHPRADLKNAIKRMQSPNYSFQQKPVILLDEYSKLLSTCIQKESQPVVVSPGPCVKIDLTDETDDDVLFTPKKNEKSQANHFKLYDGSEGRRLRKPHKKIHVRSKSVGSEKELLKLKETISLDSDDEGNDDCVITNVKTPTVPKINTLEDKLKSDHAVAYESWTNKMIRDYEDKKAELEDLTNKLSNHLKLIQDSNKITYDDYSIKLIGRHLHLTESIVDDLPQLEEQLPVLTREMMEAVNNASRKKPEDEVLIEKFNYSIKRQDVHTLTGLYWLNDEVINFYLTLIMERSKEKQNLPKTYCFSTFFFLRLVNSGHAGVRRWTKKVDIFSYDIIIIPVHLKMHWCLAAINLNTKTIKYYDSMGNDNDQCLNKLEEYLIAEALDKKNQHLNKEEWTKLNVKDIPRQMNGSDCGVFSCTFAEFLSRQAKFTFQQDDMPYIRQKMIYEIVTGQLLI